MNYLTRWLVGFFLSGSASIILFYIVTIIRLGVIEKFSLLRNSIAPAVGCGFGVGFVNAFYIARYWKTK